VFGRRDETMLNETVEVSEEETKQNYNNRSNRSNKHFEFLRE